MIFKETIIQKLHRSKHETGVILTLCIYSFSSISRLFMAFSSSELGTRCDGGSVHSRLLLFSLLRDEKRMNMEGEEIIMFFTEERNNKFSSCYSPQSRFEWLVCLSTFSEEEKNRTSFFYAKG